MKRMAVTGSSGYVGSALVERLSSDASEYCLIGFDRYAPVSSGCDEIYHLDLLDMPVDELAQCLRDVDVLFHLAAARADWGLSHDEYEKDNVALTRHLIRASRLADVQRWIYFSTVGVYGPSDTPLDEDAPLRPQTDYGRTKAIAERELLESARGEGWALRVLRPSAVFSEGQPANTNIYRLIEAIRLNKFIMVGSGQTVKTTSYLYNVIDATMWMHRDLLDGGIRVFNYVDEPRLTTIEMVRMVRRELNKQAPLLRLPVGLVEPPARLMDWLAERVNQDFPITAARIRKFTTPTNYDSSRIRGAGFDPRFSSEEGLLRTIQAHREGQGQLK